MTVSLIVLACLGSFFAGFMLCFRWLWWSTRDLGRRLERAEREMEHQQRLRSGANASVHALHRRLDVMEMEVEDARRRLHGED